MFFYRYPYFVAFVFLDVFFVFFLYLFFEWRTLHFGCHQRRLIDRRPQTRSGDFAKFNFSFRTIAPKSLNQHYLGK